MSDEDPESKTEEATTKRLEDSKKKGDVANSQEVKHVFILGAFLAVLLVIGPNAMADLKITLRTLLGQGFEIATDGPGLVNVMATMAGEVISALSFTLLLFMVAGVAAVRVQHEFLWAPDKIKPKLKKLNPIEGFKKKFAMSNLVEFIKSMVKLVLVGVMVGLVVSFEIKSFDLLMTLEPAALLIVLQSLAVKILSAVLFLVIIMALADFVYQKFDFLKKQKMTKQEVKDEHKQADGNPEVKRKIRQLRMERAMVRMMTAVPEASVVVVNPTHYAVALKYVQDEMDAPVCVAKGVNEIALRIRSVAEEHDIPIMENAPLARSLHATIDLNEEVPPEQYKAVAEVIGFVMRMQKKRSWSMSKTAAGS